MPFNINEMMSSLNKTGIAKKSNFEVQLSGPGDDISAERDLLYRAVAVNLPGRNISTTQYKFSNYGPLSKIPYGQLYGDVTVEFLLSEDMREKEYFENWQNEMVDTGAFEVNNGIKSRRLSKFNTKYFDDYTGRIIIRQYDSTGGIASIHTLHECYPLLISDIAMSWSDGDAARMSVGFAYRNYSVVFNKKDQPGLGKGFSFKLSLGSSGLSLDASARLPGIGNVSTRLSSGLNVINANVGRSVAQLIRS